MAKFKLCSEQDEKPSKQLHLNPDVNIYSYDLCIVSLKTIKNSSMSDNFTLFRFVK